VNDAYASLNWLARERPDLQAVRDGLAAIVEQGHRAAEVLQRTRELAKKSAPQKAPLDVNDVIRAVVPLVRAELSKHEVALHLDLATDLPLVEGDRVQLQQVVINLVINAGEATAPLTDRPREVAIRSAPDGSGHVTVSVRDNGTGIDPTTVDAIFGAFVTTKPGGMGMGLSISRSIIDAHGGQLWTTPNSPHGAVFHVRLSVITPRIEAAAGRPRAS
jgi:C4-dicarboxylate-specific signal transduction histidine kinase